MESIASPVIRFAGVEIDVRKECVRVGGIEQRLRPKTFEVLLFLIENRGRVVSKSEIFEAVWGGTAVTEDTLVQSIVEIRKALGDDPRSPEFVRTIPRVGYRMIGLIEPTTEAANPLSEPASEPTTETPVAPAPSRRRPVMAAAAAVVAVLAVMAGVWANRRGQPAEQVPQEPAAAGRMNVAIALFESHSKTPDLDWLGEGLPMMVMTHLARERHLALIDRGVIERLSRTGASRWLDVARRAGAQRLITGRFERSGERIRVDAQLYDVASGRLMGGSSIVSTRESLLDDVDLLSSRLTLLLGSKEPGERARRTDRMTDSLDAYEAYTRGLAAANGLNNTEAVTQFEKAIALDPRFAMAYGRIGYTYAVTWTLPDQAKPYFAKALALGEHLNERERLYVMSWQSIAERDYTRAIDHFRLIVSRYPTDIEGYAGLGRLLIGEERLPEAIEVLSRGLVVDPESPALNNAIGTAYSYRGQHAEAIAHHQRYVTAMPREPNAHDSLGLSYQWAGEYERALAEYDEALRNNPRFEVAVAHRASAFWQMGRNREATRELRRYIDMAPLSDERLRGYNELFLMMRSLGTVDPEVIRRIQEKPERFQFDILLAIDRKDLPAVARLAQSMRPLSAGRGGRSPVRLWSYVRAEAARALGNEAQALEYARETLRHAPPIYLANDMEDTLGDTLVAFGRHAEAVDEYHRILGLNANRGRTRYKLAVALDALGKHAEARAEYEHFLRLWKTADSDAPEILDARRWLSGRDGD